MNHIVLHAKHVVVNVDCAQRANRLTAQHSLWSKRGAPDRNKVAGSEAYEVDYMAKKLGVTPEQVKAAIKKVGNTRTKVEAELRKI